jgi:exosortase D (VPLPA-CTERM-specific)
MRDIFKDIRIQVGTLAVLFLFAYWIPLRAMVFTWWENEDYSYGFLIPLVTAYLFWEKRHVLKKAQVKSAWIVLPLLIFFVLLSIYGILGSSGNISMPAIPILIILYAAFCYGIQIVKRLILPLGFMVFMVPVPAVIDRTIGLYLKAISSKLGGAFIGLFNIPVHVSGNVIDLGITQLQVVDACSGLRYMFPLLAIGVLYAYLFERVAWKRILCVVMTIPIGVLTNAFRIGITGILANSYGPEVAQGFFHGFSSWILFLVAFAFLFLLGWILRFISPENREKKPGEPEEMVYPEAPGAGQRKAFYTSVSLLLIVAVLSLSTKALPAVKIKGGIESFSLTFAGWQGRAELVDPEIVIKSGAEESFSALYRNSTQDVVSLYIGYRSTAFLSNENFFHSPTVCLPASGWEEKETVTHLVKDVPLFGNITVTRMIIERMGARELVYFWFQTKDKATHDKNINRFHLTLHALTRDNTHDLFIRPIMPMNKGETVEDAEKRLDQFVREMMAEMLKFLKEKQVKEKA